MFEYSCCRHMSMVWTGKSRCLSYQSCPRPLPCVPHSGSYGPAPWNSLAAYGHYNPYGNAVAAQPAAPAAPAATPPSFKAPSPAPATNGVKQALYSVGQPTNPGYGYNAGYNYYGAGSGYIYYGYNYAQAPNYWY
jgi:hypothetical protein